MIEAAIDWDKVGMDKTIRIQQEEITKLKQQIEDATNCLVCAAIADPYEVVSNTLDILETK